MTNIEKRFDTSNRPMMPLVGSAGEIAALRSKLTDTDRANDELRQEAERLRADAAYGQTAMDSYAVVQRERDQYRGTMRAWETQVRSAEARVAHLEGALREVAGNGPPRCTLFDGRNGLDCIEVKATLRCMPCIARRALTASPTMTPAKEDSDE